VTTEERRDRVEGERASKPNGEREGSSAHQREVPEVRSDPVRAEGQSSTRQSSWGDSHGARGVKEEKVMERVYEWGRLRMAWKQIEKNAPAEPGHRQDDGGSIQEEGRIPSSRNPRKVESWHLPIPTRPKSTHREGGFHKEEEAGDSHGYGSDRESKCPFGLTWDL